MHSITKFHHWMLRRIFALIVRQSRTHAENITEAMRLLIAAADKEFYEDNDPTLYDFIRGRFEDAMDKELNFHNEMRDVYKHGVDGKL